MAALYIGGNKKATRQRLIIVVVIVCAISILTTLAYVALKSGSDRIQVAQPTPAQQKEVLPEKNKPSLPVRLVIDKLKVDTQVTQVGLTENGDMDIPSSIMETGWYKYGPHPGDVGSAVVAGHLNGVGGEPGVFIDLEKLQKGDGLSIIDDKGQTISFTVREIRYYGQYEKPSEVFNSSAGAHLNLITCAGTWNETELRYSKRLVVFSDRSN